MASIKKIVIPLNDIKQLSVTPDNAASGQPADIRATLRYRIVSEDRNRTSEWSPIYDLSFTDPVVGSLLQTRTISMANGFKELTPARATGYSALVDGTGSMMQSTIEKLTSNEQDLFKYSWIVPPSLNVGAFDVHLSWRSAAYVIAAATLGAPSGAGPYTGTITLSGTGAQNAANALRAFYVKSTTEGDGTVLYAGPNSTTPAAAFTIVSGTSTNGTGLAFNVSSASSWTSSGTVRHVFRSNPYTDFQYANSTSSNSYTFNRTKVSNIQFARITKDSNQVQLIPDKDSFQTEGRVAYYSGIVVGMELKKLSGDGNFATTAIVSAIDYDTDTLTISTDEFGATAAPHIDGGDITFVADNREFTATVGTGVTQQLWWNMPMYVQGMLHASNPLRSPDSLYSLLSLSPALTTFFGGYGTISGATTTAPFTATIVGCGLPFPSGTIDMGRKIYAPNDTGAGSLGGGSVTLADYITGSRVSVHGTAALTNGLITNLTF